MITLIQITLRRNIVHVRNTALSHSQARIAETDNRPTWVGGSGLAAFSCSTTDLDILVIPESGAMHAGSDKALLQDILSSAVDNYLTLFLYSFSHHLDGHLLVRICHADSSHGFLWPNHLLFYLLGLVVSSQCSRDFPCIVGLLLCLDHDFNLHKHLEIRASFNLVLRTI